MDLSTMAWRKSTYSATESACVEVAFGGERAAMRDSKDPSGGALVLSGSAFAALTVEARAQRVRALGE